MSYFREEPAFFVGQRDHAVFRMKKSKPQFDRTLLFHDGRHFPIANGADPSRDIMRVGNRSG